MKVEEVLYVHNCMDLRLQCEGENRMIEMFLTIDSAGASSFGFDRV